MTGPVLLSVMKPPPVRHGEVLRYARAAEGDAVAEALLSELLPAAEGVLTYRVAFRELPVTKTDCGLTVGPLRISSSSLGAHLCGAKSALVLAATVGVGLDRLILRYEKASPARALLLDALGSERVESLLDAFTAEREAEGYRLTSRFSPGYLDLPLSLQKDILPLLDGEKLLGLSLGSRLLLSPQKSVTAIVGVLGRG